MLKPEQERVKSVLIESVSLLCKNGLNFKCELKVEGVIGITIDGGDIFVIHIDKKFGNENQAASSFGGTTSEKVGNVVGSASRGGFSSARGARGGRIAEPGVRKVRPKIQPSMQIKQEPQNVPLSPRIPTGASQRLPSANQKMTRGLPRVPSSNSRMNYSPSTQVSEHSGDAQPWSNTNYPQAGYQGTGGVYVKQEQDNQHSYQPSDVIFVNEDEGPVGSDVKQHTDQQSSDVPGGDRFSEDAGILELAKAGNIVRSDITRVTITTDAQGQNVKQIERVQSATMPVKMEQGMFGGCQPPEQGMFGRPAGDYSTADQSYMYGEDQSGNCEEEEYGASMADEEWNMQQQQEQQMEDEMAWNENGRMPSNQRMNRPPPRGRAKRPSAPRGQGQAAPRKSMPQQQPVFSEFGPKPTNGGKKAPGGGGSSFKMVSRYVCDIDGCNASFSMKSNLRRHQRSKHSTSSSDFDLGNDGYGNDDEGYDPNMEEMTY